MRLQDNPRLRHLEVSGEEEKRLIEEWERQHPRPRSRPWAWQCSGCGRRRKGDFPRWWIQTGVDPHTPSMVGTWCEKCQVTRLGAKRWPGNFADRIATIVKIEEGEK